MKNLKAKCETMCNVSLKDFVFIPDTRSYQKLEKHLMTLKHNNNQLFLAAEQGLGKFEQDVTVVINPRTTSKSREWLAIDAKTLSFEEGKTLDMSVNAKEFQQDIQHN